MDTSLLSAVLPGKKKAKQYYGICIFVFSEIPQKYFDSTLKSRIKRHCNESFDILEVIF